MKQITDIIQTILTLIAFGTFASLGLMWSINQWSAQTGFEMTFWQSSSIFLLIFMISLLGLFIRNILNYNR